MDLTNCLLVALCSSTCIHYACD